MIKQSLCGTSKVKHLKLAWDAMHELKEEMNCTLNMNTGCWQIDMIPVRVEIPGFERAWHFCCEECVHLCCPA